MRGTIYHVIIKHNVSELETVLGDDIEDHRLGESEVPAARPAFRGFNISRFVECHLCDSFYCSFEEYQTHFATDHRSNSEESSGVREREIERCSFVLVFNLFAHVVDLLQSNISLSLADIWPGDSSGRESTPHSSSSREATPPPPARPASKKNGRRQKQCHICGKFMLTSNIPYHTRRHKEVKSFRCDICLNFFKPVDMSRHRRLAETCKFCGKKFCGIRKMRQHVQEQHGSSSKHVFLKYSYKWSWSKKCSFRVFLMLRHRLSSTGSMLINNGPMLSRSHRPVRLMVSWPEARFLGGAFPTDIHSLSWEGISRVKITVNLRIGAKSVTSLEYQTQIFEYQ